MMCSGSIVGVVAAVSQQPPEMYATTDSRVKVKMLAYDTASESDFDQGHCSYHPPGLRDLRSKIHIQIPTQNTTEVAKFEWLVSSFALT